MVSKLPDVGTTIFTVMSRLAMEHGAGNFKTNVMYISLNFFLFKNLDMYYK